MNAHLNFAYPDDTDGSTPRAYLGNIAMGVGDSLPTVGAGRIVFTIVNYREEKTLKNLPNYVRNDATLRASYENPPQYLNFMLLMAATDDNYALALTDLSRVFRFFQAQRVFTPDTVAPTSIAGGIGALDEADQLDTFKLILDLYSPSLEETNHLWGTLGGKQYPFALYMVRLLDLKYRMVQRESGLITEVVTDFAHKQSPS
ncbi:MAG TPA: DUF4255 domain-containing protein [Saprospiraceae bacterium]|nr:DUF4255 domain-containing protein [Saprospiraceae bacterium]